MVKNSPALPGPRARNTVAIQTIDERKDKQSETRAKTYKRNAKRLKTNGKAPTDMEIMSKYREHLCRIHTDENGVRRCLTGHCPLSRTSCYTYPTFADFYSANHSDGKKDTKRIVMQAMKEEGWTAD